MTHPLKCVVIDDDSFFRKTVQSGIVEVAKGDVSIQEVEDGVLKEEILQLSRHRASLRGVPGTQQATSLFDGVDIAFVDFDLVAMGDDGAMTGEDVAYLLRCFSGVSIVVVMNPSDRSDRFFDLSLRKSWGSNGDLVIGSEHAFSKWLWSDVRDGFSPWSWFNLVESVSRRKMQIEAIADCLDSPIDKVLGLADEDLNLIATLDLVTLGSSKATTRGERGRDVGASRSTCLPCAREVAESFVHRKDWPAIVRSDEQVCRVAAARTSSWMEHIVLSSQASLVDAPHLVARLPGVLRSDSSLDKLCSRSTSVAKALCDSLSECRLDSIWLSRPTYRWSKVSARKEFFDWAAAGLGGKVFAEDISAFIDGAAAGQFRGPPPAHLSTRYVRPLAQRGDIQYLPPSLLSL